MKDNSYWKDKLINLCQKIYSSERILEDSFYIGKDIIEFARKNRLVYYLVLEYSEVFKEDEQLIDVYNRLICEYNDYKKSLKHALEITKDILNGREFMIIKTFSSFSHLTNDVDVLVKDLKVTEEFRKKIKILNKEVLLPIDINTKISWGGADAVSDDFVWNNTQKFSFEGIDFLVPNPLLDAIIRIAHIPFEVAHIKLGELLHIYKQLSLSEWTVLENEAKFMNWPKTFQKMLNILELLHYKLFKRPFFGKNIVAPSSSDSIEFPFKLPISILAGGVIEKRAWRKIFGGRFIIKDRIAEWIQENIF